MLSPSALKKKDVVAARAKPNGQKFFGSFFQKRTLLFSWRAAFHLS
jgi:hypothetical protein